MIRVSVAETLHEDFVRTARAKGAGETRVLRRHVLPTASLRVLTMVGMEIGTAIGVCVYIETVYGDRRPRTALRSTRWAARPRRSTCR